MSGNVRIEAEEMRLHISTPVRYHAPGEKLPAKHRFSRPVRRRIGHTFTRSNVGLHVLL